MWRIQYLDLKDPGEAESLFRKIGVHPYGGKAMLPKAEFLHVYLEGIGCSIGNILKQEMLSLGGEVAVSRGTVDCSSEKTDALVMGTRKQLRALAEKLVVQPFGLRSLGERLSTLLDRIERTRFVVKTPQRELVLGERTLIMGILNITPDSFSDGGRYLDAGEAVRRGVRIEEEGAEIINDISALSFDPDMAGAAARAGVPVVLMHIRGVPKTMQQGDLAYGSLMMDILAFLESRIAAAREAGIAGESILIDPGLGFGKTAEDNLAVLLHLKELKTLGRPVLVGPSRKAFIGRITGKDAPDRLAGTAAAVAAAVLNGAHVVRVHDVEFMKDVVLTADAVRRKALP